MLMNNHYIILLIAILFLGELNLVAQTDSLPVTNSDTIMKNLLQIEHDLSEIKNIINNDRKTSNQIGEIFLKSNAYLYRDKNVVDTISILNVEIFLEDGFIRSIRCEDKNNKIYYKSDINVFLGAVESNFNSSNEKLNSRLYDIESNNNIYIKLYDLIQYRSTIGNRFIPEDGVIELSADKSKYSLNKNIDLNSHIEFKIYSDLLGLLEQQPNGLIQSEISSLIPLVIDPNLGPGGLFSLNSGFWFLGITHIKPNLTFKRFDSSISSYDLSNELNLNELSEQSYFNIIQRSFLDVGLDFNLLNVSKPNIKFDINLGSGYSFSKVMLKDSVESNINFSTTKIGASYKILRYDNFGFILDLDFIFPNFNASNILIPRNEFSIFRINSEIFYHPLDNKQNHVYVKFGLLTPMDNIDNVESFPLLQIGYKTKLKFNKNGT